MFWLGLCRTTESLRRAKKTREIRTNLIAIVYGHLKQTVNSDQGEGFESLRPVASFGAGESPPAAAVTKQTAEEKLASSDNGCWSRSYLGLKLRGLNL